MSWIRTYSLLTGMTALLGDPALALMERFSKRPSLWGSRRGKLLADISQKGPFDVWMHGASVGEMAAIKAITEKILKIRPETRIMVSAFTESGFSHGKRLFEQTIPVTLFPFDYPQAAVRAASLVSPRVFCSVETEIWPNFLWTLKRRGTKLALLNARISADSFPSYRRFRFFFREVLGLFDVICAISRLDKKRLCTMGANPQMVEVCGNAKYEYLIERPDEKKARDVAKMLSIPSNRPVVVAGSIRGHEYRHIYRCAEQLKAMGIETLFILVPRHLERVKEIRDFLSEKGERSQTLTERLEHRGRFFDPGCKFLVIDEMGWLFDLYGLCDVAFVGGSLVPKGGQNIMEPAAWARPVLFGPHTENFQDATEALLAEGGGFVVEDHTELTERLKTLLTEKEYRKRAGACSRKALLKLGNGAATRQAERLLRNFLESTPPRMPRVASAQRTNSTG